MTDQLTESEVVEGIGSDYEIKYGFHVAEDYFFKSGRGLSHELVDAISSHKNEPDWMRKFRHKSLDYFLARPMPNWGGALDGVESSRDRAVEVEDRYVDTAYGALEQAGFGARLRREDHGPVVLTVKTTSRERPAERDEEPESESAALSQRVEVEGPAGDRLDPDEWPPSAARDARRALHVATSRQSSLDSQRARRRPARQCRCLTPTHWWTPHRGRALRASHVRFPAVAAGDTHLGSRESSRAFPVRPRSPL